MSAASPASKEPSRQDEPKPGEDVFTDADLEPSADDRRARRRRRIDVGAAVVAALAAGLWMGGMVALGACAAPMVFQHVPPPLSGTAMGAAFARFDALAMGCVVVLLAAEVVRTVLALKRRTGAVVARVRRYCAILLALGVVYTGAVITPSINELYRAGVRRNVGADGGRLEQLHHRAELLGKIGLVLGLVVLTLHVVTSARRDPNEDPLDEDAADEAVAPLPPGPRR